MTWIEVCQEEARKAGVELTDAEADYVLWEHTGFPHFFTGDDREACFRAQIRRWAQSVAETVAPEAG